LKFDRDKASLKLFEEQNLVISFYFWSREFFNVDSAGVSDILVDERVLQIRAEEFAVKFDAAVTRYISSEIRRVHRMIDHEARARCILGI